MQSQKTLLVIFVGTILFSSSAFSEPEKTVQQQIKDVEKQTHDNKVLINKVQDDSKKFGDVLAKLVFTNSKDISDNKKNNKKNSDLLTQIGTKIDVNQIRLVGAKALAEDNEKIIKKTGDDLSDFKAKTTTEHTSIKKLVVTNTTTSKVNTDSIADLKTKSSNQAKSISDLAVQDQNFNDQLIGVTKKVDKNTDDIKGLLKGINNSFHNEVAQTQNAVERNEKKILDGEVLIKENHDTISKQKAKIDNVVATASKNKNSIAATNTLLSKNETKISHNTDGIKAHTELIGAVVKEVETDKKNIVSNKQNINIQRVRLANNETKIDKNKSSIHTLGTAVVRNVSNIDKLNNQTQANKAAISQNSRDIANLKLDFEQYKKKTNVVFAGIAAMNNIPLVEGKKLSLGAGVGYYDHESAVSFGGNYKVNENVVVKTSLAGNPNNWQPIIGAGVAIGF